MPMEAMTATGIFSLGPSAMGMYIYIYTSIDSLSR